MIDRIRLWRPPSRPVRWTVLLYDPKSKKHIADLTQALRGRKLSFDVDDAAHFSAGLSGRSPEAKRLFDPERDAELRLDVLVYRGDRLMFRGRLGTTEDDIDSDAHALPVNALDYRALLMRRYLYSGHTAETTPIRYDQVNQAKIARDLINLAQGRARDEPWPHVPRPGGDLGIEFSEDAKKDAGPKRDREWEPGKSLGEALQQLGNVIDGFEWEIDPELRFQLYYRPPSPTWSGHRGVERSLVLDLGRNLHKVRRQWTAEEYGNAVIAVGAEEAGAPVVLPDPNATWTGGDRFELAFSDLDIKRADTLREKAEALLEQGKEPTSYELELEPGVWQGLEQLWLGDHVTLRIRSGRLNVDRQVRVLGVEIDIGDDGEERAKLDVHRRAGTYERRLRRLDDNLGRVNQLAGSRSRVEAVRREVEGPLTKQVHDVAEKVAKLEKGRGAPGPGARLVSARLRGVKDPTPHGNKGWGELHYDAPIWEEVNDEDHLIAADGTIVIPEEGIWQVTWGWRWKGAKGMLWAADLVNEKALRWARWGDFWQPPDYTVASATLANRTDQPGTSGSWDAHLTKGAKLRFRIMADGGPGRFFLPTRGREDCFLAVVQVAGAGAAATTTPADVEKRLKALESRPAVSLQPIEDRLKALEQRKSTPPDLAPVNHRIDELVKKIPDLSPLTKQVGELAGKIPDRLVARLTALEARKPTTADFDHFQPVVDYYVSSADAPQKSISLDNLSRYGTHLLIAAELKVQNPGADVENCVWWFNDDRDKRYYSVFLAADGNGAGRTGRMEGQGEFQHIQANTTKEPGEAKRYGTTLIWIPEYATDEKQKTVLWWTHQWSAFREVAIRGAVWNKNDPVRSIGFGASTPWAPWTRIRIYSFN